MKNIEEIKIESWGFGVGDWPFKEFLRRLGQHKIDECMDIVPLTVDYEKIKIQKDLLD